MDFLLLKNPLGTLYPPQAINIARFAPLASKED
jgi:hypothetical protein